MNNVLLENRSEYFGGWVGEGRKRYHLSSHMEAVLFGQKQRERIGRGDKRQFRRKTQPVFLEPNCIQERSHLLLHQTNAKVCKIGRLEK